MYNTFILLYTVMSNTYLVNILPAFITDYITCFQICCPLCIQHLHFLCSLDRSHISRHFTQEFLTSSTFLLTKCASHIIIITLHTRFTSIYIRMYKCLSVYYYSKTIIFTRFSYYNMIYIYVCTVLLISRFLLFFKS